jgi:lysozyme family protein
MQQALDYIEKNKIFIEDLKTDMIPLTVAYKAIEMAIDNQIAEAMEALQTQLGGLVEDLETITSEEND